LLFTVLISGSARAEFPAGLSAWAGFGAGSGHREEVKGSGWFGLAGIEAAWRYAPGRALVVACEGASDGGQIFIPESPRLQQLEHRAITIGPEFSYPRGSSIALFYRGAAGVGRVMTSGFRSMPSYDYDPFAPPAEPLAQLTETGFAWSAAAGLRLVLPPGPVGFTFALRGAHVYARHSSAGDVGGTFGLTVYPLSRRSSRP
jgi:hypothetical protein